MSTTTTTTKRARHSDEAPQPSKRRKAEPAEPSNTDITWDEQLTLERYGRMAVKRGDLMKQRRRTILLELARKAGSSKTSRKNTVEVPAGCAPYVIVEALVRFLEARLRRYEDENVDPLDPKTALLRVAKAVRESPFDFRDDLGFHDDCAFDPHDPFGRKHRCEISAPYTCTHDDNRVFWCADWEVKLPSGYLVFAYSMNEAFQLRVGRNTWVRPHFNGEGYTLMSGFFFEDELY